MRLHELAQEPVADTTGGYMALCSCGADFHASRKWAALKLLDMHIEDQEPSMRFPA